MQSVSNIIPLNVGKRQKKGVSKKERDARRGDVKNYVKSELEITKLKHPTEGVIEKYVCLPGTTKAQTVPIPSLTLRISPTRKTLVVRYRKEGKTLKKTLPQGITVTKAAEYVARLKGGLPLAGTEIVEMLEGAKQGYRDLMDATLASNEQTIIKYLPDYYFNFLIEAELKRPEIVQDLFVRLILPALKHPDSTYARDDYQRLSDRAYAYAELTDDKSEEAEQKRTEIEAEIAEAASHFAPVANITKAQLHESIKHIRQKNGASPAKKALSYMSNFVSFAAIPEGIDSPADGLGKMFKFKPSERTRVLNRDEVPLFYAALDESQISDHVKIAFRLLLLLGMRSGEMAQAEWAHVNISQRRWIIPGENTKNGDKLIIPLPRQAVELLEQLHKITGKHKMLMGGTRRDVFTKALTRIQRPRVRAAAILQLDSAITPHDLRRSLSTFLNGMEGIEPYVVEKMLNHRMQGVMAVYNRQDYMTKRTAAHQRYADALDKPTTLPKPKED